MDIGILIVPSVASMLYADTIGRRLTFGLVLIAMAAARPFVHRHAVS